MGFFLDLRAVSAPVLPLLLLAVLTGCLPPVDPSGGDAGVTGDAGTDDAGVDAGLALVPGWNPTTQLGPTRDGFSTEIRNVDVDLGAEGTDAIVVWEETGETHGSVWARRFVDGAWQPELRLSEAGIKAGVPRVAFNAAGQAVVVHEVHERNTNGESLGRAVWFRRLGEAGWSTPERLSPEPPTFESGSLFEARAPRVALDDSGRVTVAWTQYASDDSARSGLFLRRHDGTTWGEPLRLNEGSLPASDPQLAVGAGGRGVALWIQDTHPYDPGRSGGGPRVPNVWARSFDGTTWGPPTRIGPELADFEGTERPVLTIDASGQAFALWEEHRLEEARIGAARFDPERGAWDAPVTVASSAAPTHHLSFLSVATDGRGNAFATWTANLPDSDQEAGMASRFDGANAQWNTASAFATGGSMDGIRAAMGTRGQGWAISTQPSDAGSSNLIAHEFLEDGAWGPAQVIGGGWVSDAEGNAQGVLLIGAHQSWYGSSQPLMRTAPAAAFFLPGG